MGRRSCEPLSQIFSVTDEAFALVMLYNEGHCWEERAKKGKSESHKRYCNPYSGRKQGWSSTGMNVFHKVCKTIAARRKEEESIALEKNIMEHYARSTPRNPNNLEDDDSIESDFQDETIADVIKEALNDSSIILEGV